MAMMTVELSNMDYNNLTWDEIYSLIREDKMKLLGYANRWSIDPPEVINANKNKYKYYSERGFYDCETIYYCPEGGFYYYMDSSD